MTTETRTLEFKRTINAPVEQVYRAFTNAQALREWFCDVATVQPRVGGRIYLAWNTGNALFGKYLALTPNAKIEVALRSEDDTDRSQVQITLAAQGESTQLTLVDASDGAGWHKIIKEIERGWNEGLDNLKSVLETGVDLREVKRPMLGIFFAEQKADDQGARLSGVMDDMDAKKAGLQKDDVILSIGGKATPDWPRLTAVLQTHRAGDTVDVVFDRADERKTASVKLSPRVIPEAPTTPAALAETIKRAYTASNQELQQLLNGVDDQRSAHPPAPSEWSMKHILAHLTVCERDMHTSLMGIIGGQERWQDDWEGNIPVRLDALMQVHGTAQAILQEFMRHEAETVAILAGLPAEFVARKRSYRRLAQEMIGWVDHTREHVEQIRSVLKNL